MNNFYSTTSKAINDYKTIIRKTLPPAKYAAKIREFGIKRSYIKQIDEIGLYELGLKIIAELKKDLPPLTTPNNKKSNNSYSGVEEFLQHLESLFAQYRIENNQVVHLGQKSSCALVSAIQLITLPKIQLDAEIICQLKQLAEIVINYGSEEQKKMLIDALGSDTALLPLVLS